MNHPAWTLVVIGGLILAIGLALLTLSSIPWLGRLPGDIAIERDKVHFYFPVTTCILVSVVLSGILWLVRYFSR